MPVVACIEDASATVDSSSLQPLSPSGYSHLITIMIFPSCTTGGGEASPRA
jgi:hypothetical protein